MLGESPKAAGGRRGLLVDCVRDLPVVGRSAWLRGTPRLYRQIHIIHTFGRDGRFRFAK